jgi:ubiquinone biosynthesis monooxygenase Coq6
VNKIPESRVRFGANVTDVVANGKNVDIIIDGNEKLSTSLVVGCDGFQSLVRGKSDLKYFEQDLQQQGIVGTIEVSLESESDLNDVTIQRFVPWDESVVALLPLTANYSSFVISANNKRSAQLMALSDEEFVAAFNDYLFGAAKSSSLLASCVQGLDRILGTIIPSSGPFSPNPPPRLSPPQVLSVVPGSRASFPLKFGTTVPYMVGSVVGSDSKNLVLIGDSAHRIPPLAGQGLNLGIGDAQVLAQSLTESLARGENLFDQESKEHLENALLNFERKRQFKLIPMMAAIVSMQQLFSATPSTLMSSFNKLGIIKNEIVKFANSR